MRLRSPCRLALLLAVALAGCGSSSSDTRTDAGRSSDASHVDAHKGPTADAGKDTGKSATHDASTDAAVVHDTGLDVGDPGDTFLAIPFEAGSGVRIDGGSAPITGVSPGQWTWVPFPEALCRDGSTTGIGLNLIAGATKVVLFFEGGGACFDQLTCNLNPSHFAQTDFDQFFGVVDGGAGSGLGILDRTNAANPVKDWSFVYVPYCTGDIHAGNAPAAMVPGVSTPQAFVGYVNVDLYLQRLVPTFSAATQVLLTGVSGGGFGAAANYVHVQRAFGSIPVDLIDDSGPFMENPYLATCLQTQVRTLWNMDTTVGVDCAGACSSTATFFMDFAKHVAKTSPARTLGLVESTDDGTIRNFFGFSDDSCQAFAPEDGGLFAAGLTDIRTQFASDSTFGSFYFPGTDHTSLEDPVFYTRTAGTTPLTTWVGQMIAGSASNVGP